MDTQMRTTRKTIDFTDEQVRRMDQARQDRKATYNELIGAAVDAYLSPQASVPSGEQLPQQLTLEQIQQRLWNLDSASQKTAERLALLERVAQESMELLILIAESLSKTPVPAPETTTLVPATLVQHPEQQACEAWLSAINREPTEPPPVVPEKRKWWGVPPWER